MRCEQNGKWEVTKFRILKKGASLELRREEDVKFLVLAPDFIKSRPDLFHKRTNLFLSFFSDQEIAVIEKEYNKYHIRLRIVKMLAKKDVAIDKIREYFESREWALDGLDEVLDDLKREGLLDEEKTIRDRIDYYLERYFYGRDRIIHTLIRQGFSESLVYSLIKEVPEEKFIEAARHKSARIQKRVQQGGVKKKILIRSVLVKNGYDEEIAAQVAAEVPYRDEQKYLIEDLERLKRKYKNIRHLKGSYYNRIVNALQRKGYNFFYIDQVFSKDGENW